MGTMPMKAIKVAERISQMDDISDVRELCERIEDEHELVELSLILYDMYLGAKSVRKMAEGYENKLLVFTSVVQKTAKAALSKGDKS